MRGFHPAITLLLALALSACVSTGSGLVRADRNAYNEAFQETSAQQLLLNVLRAAANESAFFMEPTEIDAASNLQTTVMGGPSAIGAVTGALGFVTGGATFSDAPIVKYAPLTGNALVAQVASPITLGSIAKLSTSGWPYSVLLALAFNRLTPEFMDFYRAVDTIDALDAYGALTVIAPGDDSFLTLGFAPRGSDTVAFARKTEDRSLACAPADEAPGVVTGRLWRRLRRIFGRDGGSIVMTTTHVASPSINAQRVDVYTRSAIGALRNVDPTIVSYARARRMIDANRAAGCFTGEYYYDGDGDGVEAKWKRTADLVYGPGDVATDQEFRLLGRERIYVLVVESADAPPGAYVTVRRKGRCYSILDDDVTSKRNLELLNQILTIQSAPAPAPAPTQTAIVR